LKLIGGPQNSAFDAAKNRHWTCAAKACCSLPPRRQAGKPLPKGKDADCDVLFVDSYTAAVAGQREEQSRETGAAGVRGGLRRPINPEGIRASRKRRDLWIVGCSYDAITISGGRVSRRISTTMDARMNDAPKTEFMW